MSASSAVLPSAKYNGEKYFYFGLEMSGKLSTFGGLKEVGETHEKCALREFAEESLEVFATAKKAQKIFKNKQFEQINNTSPSHQNVTYLVRLKKTKKFDKLFSEALKNPNLTACQKEMQKIVAVRAKTLKKGLKEGNFVFQGYPLRPCVIATLQIARLAKKL